MVGWLISSSNYEWCIAIQVFDVQSLAFVFAVHFRCLYSSLVYFLSVKWVKLLSDQYKSIFVLANKNIKQKVEQFLLLLEELPPYNKLLLSWVIVHMTHVIAKVSLCSFRLGLNIETLIVSSYSINHNCCVHGVMWCKFVPQRSRLISHSNYCSWGGVKLSHKIQPLFLFWSWSGVRLSCKMLVVLLSTSFCIVFITLCFIYPFI